MNIKQRIEALAKRVAQEINSINQEGGLKVLASGTYNMSLGATNGLAMISHPNVDTLKTMVIYTVVRVSDTSTPSATLEAAKHYVVDRQSTGFRVHVTNAYIGSIGGRLKIDWKIVEK
ncbi:hypothetical protein [Myroides odoratus]|uniref:hypothetical protein n=1 Tax=Myroides odoratus TaxID=256 RepID=UPI000765E4D0|nr:hypothetical protein [Myroides odoratus]